MYLLRNQENRNQQIGHGHVYNEEVYRFSHGLRLVDYYSDDGVPGQRKKEDQRVSKGLSNFFCYRIAVQLDDRVPFILVFTFSDIASRFPFPL